MTQRGLRCPAPYPSLRGPCGPSPHFRR
jgi:hypothetical protein